MTFKRLACTTTISLVMLAGCGSDPGKKVNSAETELTSEQRQAQTEERDRKAEATRKQESEHAEAALQKHEEVSPKKTEAEIARAELEQDHRDFNAKTQERLSKIDARAKELTVKSAKLTGKKLADFKANKLTFNTQRTQTTTTIGSLETASTDGWSNAKSDVEKRLDMLEKILGDMEKDL